MGIDSCKFTLDGQEFDVSFKGSCEYAAALKTVFDEINKKHSEKWGKVEEIMTNGET